MDELGLVVHQQEDRGLGRAAGFFLDRGVCLLGIKPHNLLVALPPFKVWLCDFENSAVAATADHPDEAGG